MSFLGFYNETFRFLFEINLNNNTEWFEKNRDRYKQFVQQPLKELAKELLPTALKLDPDFNQSLNATVSRIRRDTRFTKDKSPYRNHMWIAFRHPNTHLSDGCSLWFEISPMGYRYGIGFYSAESNYMQRYRAKLIAEPQGFLEMAAVLEENGFYYMADSYKKQHFPNATDEIKHFVNVKSFAWTKSVQGVSELIEPSDIKQRLINDFLLLKPMYLLINSVTEE